MNSNTFIPEIFYRHFHSTLNLLVNQQAFALWIYYQTDSHLLHLSGIKKNWLDNLYTLTPVSIRRNCVMVFKCLNNLVPKYLANVFVPHSHIHTRTMQCTLLHIPCCCLSYGQHSFTYCGCRLWNCISNDLKAAGSVNSFRCHLAQKLLSSEHFCWV